MQREGGGEGKEDGEKKREILIFQYSYWLWSYQVQWMKFFYIFSKILTKKKYYLQRKDHFFKERNKEFSLSELLQKNEEKKNPG